MSDENLSSKGERVFYEFLDVNVSAEWLAFDHGHIVARPNRNFDLDVIVHREFQVRELTVLQRAMERNVHHPAGHIHQGHVPVWDFRWDGSEQERPQRG